MANEVRVILRLRARPETADELKAVMFDLAAQSGKEDGCNSYKVLQNQSDLLDFVLYETWRDQPSLDAHLTTEHVRDAFAKGLPLLDGGPDRQVYTAINPWELASKANVSRV
jgi:quinol monooxygenase YgiN